MQAALRPYHVFVHVQHVYNPKTWELEGMYVCIDCGDTQEQPIFLCHCGKCVLPNSLPAVHAPIVVLPVIEPRLIDNEDLGMITIFFAVFAIIFGSAKCCLVLSMFNSSAPSSD